MHPHPWVGAPSAYLWMRGTANPMWHPQFGAVVYAGVLLQRERERHPEELHNKKNTISSTNQRRFRITATRPLKGGLSRWWLGLPKMSWAIILGPANCFKES